MNASLDDDLRGIWAGWGVSGNRKQNWQQWGWRALLSAALIMLVVSQASLPVRAGSGDRTLYLHHTHTGETGYFTFKRDGVYDQSVLRQLNIFLADWRTKEPTKMDPALFDLIWQIYQEVGASQPVNIVSSYRSPKTNAMLRAKSSGVAENSQHIQGKAMDIFIPGISLTKLRETAMRHQVGGVGYYPTSGSPFVHVDTGSVRAWPRMTTAQLKRVFPDGKTLHLPVDGKPLSEKGRAVAMAEWNKCHSVPCNGVLLPPSQADIPQVMQASLDPAQRAVATVDVNSLFPAPRPGFLDASSTFPGTPNPPPFPARKSAEMLLATRGPLPQDNTALGALNTLEEPLPAPRVLMTPENTDILTAYAPDIVPDAGAQQALKILIERETTAALGVAPTAATLEPGELREGVGSTSGVDVIQNMFDLTWTAVTEAGARAGTASALAGNSAIPVIDGLIARQAEFIAPEVDHVDETLATPERLSSLHYAELYEPEGYLDRVAELGPFASRIVFESNLVAPEAYDRFVRKAPLFVGTN